MSHLFSPLALRGLALSNRITVSPMCQYSAVDGQANAWHLAHLMSMAVSGAGAVFIESTAVEPEGRITAGDLGLYDDATEAALASVLTAIRAHARVPLVMQVGHAGRKASSEVPWRGGQLVDPAAGGWPTMAPSPLPIKDDETPPAALDAAGMARIRDAFVATARRAVAIGIDGIELHFAHGYLLHEFLSPIANQRTDAYGGSLENRMRFPLEVFDAVRAAIPDAVPLGVKISATDWIEGGWDLVESVPLVAALQARGLDWVSVSSAGISPRQKIVLGPGYQVPFAQTIREATGATTLAVGLITEAEQAEHILSSGKADLIGVARAMLYDPRWPWRAAAALGASITNAPPQYWRATPQAQKHLFGETVFGAR